MDNNGAMLAIDRIRIGSPDKGGEARDAMVQVI